MGDIPNETDNNIQEEEIEKKIRLGHFWFREGAIADSRKLAKIALVHFDVAHAIFLMLHVHAKAAADAAKLLNVSPKNTIFKEWYKTSSRASRTYNALWQFLSFFSLL